MTQQVAIDRNRMYTPPKAAKILGCSEDRIRRLYRDNVLKGFTLNENAQRKHVQITGASLDDFARQERRKARQVTKTVEIPDFGEMYNALDELRKDAMDSDSVLASRIDNLEQKFDKAIEAIWTSFTKTLDAFSDRFVPDINGAANNLRIGARLDAKNAGVNVPPPQDRKKN